MSANNMEEGEVSQKPSDDFNLSVQEVSQFGVNIAGEYLQTVERIESVKSEQKQYILRDLSTTGLAILAGSLTLITVGYEHIKTPAALYIGMGVISLAVLYAFATRIKLGRRYCSIIDKEYADYSQRVAISRNLIIGQDKKIANHEFGQLSQKTPFAYNPLSRTLDASEIVVGVILVAGAFLVASGLIWNIT